MEAHAPLGSEAAPLFPDRLVESVERVAARFVRTWGFTTVAMVSAHLRITAPSGLSHIALTRRALDAMPDLAWLDPSREWFTLLDRESPMRTAVEKIYDVAGDVGRTDTTLALGKRGSFGNAPARVVAAFVARLVARVATDSPAARAGRATRDEWILIDVLRHASGAVDLSTLRQATSRFVSPKVATRVLRSSPLFLRVGQGRYRLVGTSQRTPAPSS